MGFFSKLSPLILLSIAISLLFVTARTHDEGFISVVVSNQGLDFVKGLLIKKAISSMIPLQLSQIDESVQIPVIGKVHVVLSDITIYRVNIASSYVKTGEMGIVLVASGATANLSMKWWYSYRAWLIEISDHGRASVEVYCWSFIKRKEKRTKKVQLIQKRSHL